MPPKRKVNDFEDEYVPDYNNDNDDEYRPEKGNRGRKSTKGVAGIMSMKSTKSSSSGMNTTTSLPIKVDDSINAFGGFLDLSQNLILKKDHDKRPIWISTNNIIILESFSKYYNQAYDFLIDIAEPMARPTYFQIYQLTEDSLYSAVAVSRSTDSIIKYLNILCKTNVPPEVENFIRSSTTNFGKVYTYKFPLEYLSNCNLFIHYLLHRLN